ncbi:MAG TPA: LysM peptidoglycan-binding domain-containing protein, partial [Pirellulales bacterium]|nr:LysM peptidoglycan-binding domain-containing protein [Pirellulales bacterium]
MISVLLLVFGGLLFRKLVIPDAPPLAEEAAAAVEPLTSAGMGEPPAVAVKQSRAVEPRAVETDDAANVPAAAYSSDDDVRRREAPGDPRARRSRRAAAADTVPDEDPAPKGDPFPRRRVETGNDPREEEIGDEPQRLREPRELSRSQAENARPLRDARNPVRRASAEAPLDDRTSTDDVAVRGEKLSSGSAQEPEPRVEVTAEPTPHLATAPAEDRREAEVLDTRVEQPAQDQWQRPASEPQNGNTEPTVVQDGKYTVQPNDTLWTISEKVYGNGRYFKAIYEHNRSRLPHADRLTVGTVIAVPPVSLLEQNYTGLVPKQRHSALVKSRVLPPGQRQRPRGENVYVVEEGDTLFDIARYE